MGAGAAALGFSQGAFGWGIMAMPEMGYTMVSTGPNGDQGPTEPGYIGGGMMQRSQPSQGPVITVDVEDIDATLATIEQLGGKTVTPRQAVGDMGFSAYFNDPEGNLMGLWQNAPTSG